MTEFTPYSALLGGALIGLASALLLWLNGRIAGVSGILGQVVRTPAGHHGWRWLFLGGLVLGTALYHALLSEAAPVRVGFPVALLVLAGLLTGFGTAMAGGCTSGHGVCGLGRLSLRSLVATLCFLLTALATTWVVRHLLGAGFAGAGA